MMMKKIFFLAVLLLLLTTASGCRSRTSAAQAVGQLADEAGAQTGGPWFYPAI